MKAVELYARVRRACHVEGMSQRQAARVFGIAPKTVAKMLRFSVPPGYRRSKPPARPKRRRAPSAGAPQAPARPKRRRAPSAGAPQAPARSEEHTSELQSRQYLVCRLLL